LTNINGKQANEFTAKAATKIGRLCLANTRSDILIVMAVANWNARGLRTRIVSISALIFFGPEPEKNIRVPGQRPLIFDLSWAQSSANSAYQQPRPILSFNPICYGYGKRLFDTSGRRSS
jgi:hypothetical protein